MIAIGFKGQINPSIQVGDLAFYAKISGSLGGFTTSNNLLPHDLQKLCSLIF